MRLEKLELENFRAIESAELELHGKSTVILEIMALESHLFKIDKFAVCQYY